MDLKLLLVNIAAVALMIGTWVVGWFVFVWVLIFIAEHAFNYGQVCQLC